MDSFTRAYIHAAAWTQDPNPGSGEYPEPDYAEINPAFIALAMTDCAAFQETYRADLDEISDTYHVDDTQHGHDFWLTRNGHGAGFWDRGYDLPDAVKRLVDGAHAFGEVYEQVFADGRDLAEQE